MCEYCENNDLEYQVVNTRMKVREVANLLDSVAVVVHELVSRIGVLESEIEDLKNLARFLYILFFVVFYFYFLLLFIGVLCGLGKSFFDYLCL